MDDERLSEEQSDKDWAEAVAKVEGGEKPSEPAVESPPAEEPEPELEPANPTEVLGTDDGPGIWDEVGEAAKAEHQNTVKKLEELEHRYKSETGRIPSLQRELQQLKDSIENPETPPAEDPEPEKTPQEWREFQNALPEEATAIQSYLETQGYVSKQDFDGAISKAVEERMATTEQAFQAKLFNIEMDAARPGWQDLGDSDEFTQWLQGQSDEIQQKASVPIAEHALSVIGLYDSEVAAKAAKADELSARRDAKQKRNQEVEGGRTDPNLEVDTDDAMWDEMARKAEAKAGINKRS